jgi:hypothetical protein
MALGADSIDDTDLLRTGRTRRRLGGWIPAPSTLGTFLRAFTFGHVRQLDALLGQALERAWQAGAGPGEGRLVIDVDSFVGEVCGRLKQGAAHGYTKLLGSHPILATRADTRETLHIRLRKGWANTQKGIVRFTDELIARVTRAGASGVKLLRADSGFWNTKVFERLERAGWQYSIGVRMIKTIAAAVAASRVAKLERARLVPLHATTVEALDRYARARERLCPKPRSRAFFLSAAGGALDRSQVSKTLGQITTALGLRTATVHPRAHEHATHVRQPPDHRRRTRPGAGQPHPRPCADELHARHLHAPVRAGQAPRQRPHPARAQRFRDAARASRRGGAQAGTSSRTGFSADPCSKPITNRISSAAASRWSVCTDVLCWPLSIREIAEWLVPIRLASSSWVRPRSIRRRITIRASCS